VPTVGPLYQLPACHTPCQDKCNCGDFNTHDWAQWYHDTHDLADVNGLDGSDNYGLVCESLP